MCCDCDNTSLRRAEYENSRNTKIKEKAEATRCLISNIVKAILDSDNGETHNDTLSAANSYLSALQERITIESIKDVDRIRMEVLGKREMISDYIIIALTVTYIVLITLGVLVTPFSVLFFLGIVLAKWRLEFFIEAPVDDLIIRQHEQNVEYLRTEIEGLVPSSHAESLRAQLQQVDLSALAYFYKENSTADAIA